MSTTRDLSEGFAALLNDAGAGMYRPTGAYQSGDTAIVFELLPQAPDRCIALSLFAVDQNVSLPTGRHILHVRVRGNRNDTLDAGDLADAVDAQLTGLKGEQMGATRVVQVLFYSAIPMGPDENERAVRSIRYWVDVDTQPTILRPEGGSWD